MQQLLLQHLLQESGSGCQLADLPILLLQLGSQLWPDVLIVVGRGRLRRAAAAAPVGAPAPGAERRSSADAETAAAAPEVWH